MEKASKHFSFYSKSGASLLEIALIVGLILAVLAIVFSGLASFRRISLLNSAGEQVASALHEAHSRTLSSREASQYGVHFAQDRVILFKGASFISGDPANSETLMPAGMDISAITFNGGGVDVIFDRLTGATSQYGSVTLRYGVFPRTLTVSILATGIVTTQ